MQFDTDAEAILAFHFSVCCVHFVLLIKAHMHTVVAGETGRHTESLVILEIAKIQKGLGTGYKL